MKWMRLKALPLFIIVSVIFSCVRRATEIEPTTLTYHLPSDPINLNPVISEDAYSSAIQSRIFESLVERDPKTLLFRGNIAKSWNVGADKLTYTFHLRDNIFFHDDTPLTATDVLFSYKMLMDDKIPNAHKKVYYKDVESLNAPDAHTVVFRMKRPYAFALEHLGGFEIIPKHVYEVGNFMTDERNFRGPVGSGPYRFVEWKNGVRVVLTRFEKYWGATPAIRKIEYQIIKNDAVALQALKKGDIDSYNLKPLQWTRQTNSEKFNRDFRKIKYLAPSYRYVGYNMRTFPFNDRRVRLAMAHLMDLPRIQKTILEGLAEITTGPFLPQSLQYNKSLPPLAYNPQKALLLLKEAGYTPNSKGMLEKDGNVLEIEFMVPAVGGFYDQFVSIIKEDFYKVGILLTPRKLEFQTLLEKINKREFHAVMLGWSSGIESDPYQLWHTSQRATGHNFTGFGNTESDALIEKARVTFNVTERNKLYHRFHEIVYQEQPYTFLYVGYALIALNRRFTNVNVYPAGLDMLEWKIEGNE
ncbi:MAG TPA: peptide-binding protein [Turneriella sp.]|nr:peptide-binding protein [Turneriella sp.]